jgi:hypothetical protein
VNCERASLLLLTLWGFDPRDTVRELTVDGRRSHKSVTADIADEGMEHTGHEHLNLQAKIAR